MGKVFQALCKVERLSISSITVQCLVDHSHRDIPRSFDNLLELEISFKDSHWNLLLKLLQRSPKLERLVIHKESNSSATPKLKKLPALPLVLKVFAFNNCEGSEDDLGFIECMLQNAEGLERMRIDFASSTDSHTQNQTAEKVSSFSRRSTNCQLKFNHIP
ncbi:uncharacterized protein LOC130741218 [Lotus japonicus]|uniref:uncharacterized protein LOC130741218 n=1 Tax=Lotus japonicus TaxID=34305 RepID=UPI00258394F0|nr:uncharacterized protein LOC130741218 [Lotus japonicus]